MTKTKNILMVCGCFLIATVSAAFGEIQWSPYLNIELYGGQSFFSGNNDSPVSGPNGSLVFIPGMNLNEKWTLLPSLSANYQKTRDVQELAGGGFLTQEQQNRSLALKGIYSFNHHWKGKVYSSYRQHLVIETTDESWGNGLFDNNKIALGSEVERIGSLWKSLRVGVDYYVTNFPNFQSLASQQFGSEINAGTDVLDYSAMDISFGGDRLFGEKSLVSSYLLVSNRDFSEQKIVQSGGTFSGSSRRDLFTFLSLGYRRQLQKRTLLGLELENLAGVDISYSLSNSDQNNYDASNLKYNKNYYDYSEYEIGPKINTRINGKWTLGLGFHVTNRSYGDRPVQAADGKYKSDTIETNTNTFRWSLGYPLMKRMTLEAQGAFQNTSSNMDYESVYRYNYSSSHYFVGISYQL